MTRTPQPPRSKQPWEKAVDLGLEIQELIDTDVSEEAVDQAGDFFEDVKEKCSEVVSTIERTRTVTERQQKALDNWHRGVSNWIK